MALIGFIIIAGYIAIFIGILIAIWCEIGLGIQIALTGLATMIFSCIASIVMASVKIKSKIHGGKAE
jgi:hypothetical protein